ncbi:polyphosphate kinase 2 family protein [Azospirillum ramasamyi]|uniref:Polyphosphate kinase n=1 Tax=Azospirillum ramasamyi TaxID=682998 RepID=A0A2U9SC40_9PROT|nr:polyphosphate kinase [Azospirillum ramasamyi]AWU96387.1 polyphosphate kinase [Azospirillum ramasamyi]
MAEKSGKVAKIRLAKLDQNTTRYDNAEDYDRRLGKLQKELLHIQQTYWHEKRRAIIVFEGWDAAGKGGAIRRMTEPLDPRGFHVWPISAPTPEEQSKHYLYRFWTKLPGAGSFAIFDRSWYGRVLVERVEKFANKDQWKRAYDEINEFERLLADDGARIVKLFLHITPDEQLERFRERMKNPYKRWKLTEEDLRNRAKWDDYVKATETMFDRTSTPHAPWHAVEANSKWHARIKVLEIVTAALKEGVNIAPPPIDINVAKMAAEVLGIHPDLVVANGENGANGKR